MSAAKIWSEVHADAGGDRHSAVLLNMALGTYSDPLASILETLCGDIEGALALMVPQEGSLVDSVNIDAIAKLLDSYRRRVSAACSLHELERDARRENVETLRAHVRLARENLAAGTICVDEAISKLEAVAFEALGAEAK